MRRELLIAAGPGEWRAAWLEDGAAVELHVERGDLLPPGSIQLGRVLRRVPALDAVLVEIGEDRPGFMPLRAGAAAPLDEGARVIVQIRREAQPGKGALLTTRINGDMARLDALAAEREPPAQLQPEPGFAAALALRLSTSPDAVIADDAAILPELRGPFPGATRRGAADWPVDIDALFEAALAPSLPLHGGGAVQIAESAAAVLIDVDSGTPEGAGSGQRSALRANLAAVEVIARQIRLRQLGGGIVVDFVGLDGRRPRERVRRAMVAALAGDPAQPRVLGWTQLGHLEIVRPRRLRSLGAVMLEPHAPAKNAVTLAFEALRMLYQEARANPAANWRLTVSPAVETALSGAATEALHRLEDRLSRPITLSVAPRPEAAPFDIAPL